MVDDLKKGYYLLFIDGGKRANEQGQAEGAIAVILQEPNRGKVIRSLPQKVGPVTSPHEAEYKALITGLQLAANEKLPHIAVFSDSATVVNQITRGWDKNERLTELCEQAEVLLEDFTTRQLSWISRKMNKEADKLVDQAFKGEPVEHATE